MKRLATACALVALMLALSATAIPAEQVIKIGFVAPLVGDVASFGISTKNAAELWAEQVNAKGGILGNKVQLVIEDDKGVPAETANVVSKLIDLNKVLLIMGSCTSNCTLAGAPIAQSKGVPMISGTSTAEPVTKLGNFIFRACFIDSFQGLVMAKFALNEMKADTAAMLYDVGNDYTKGLAENFEKAFKAGGGKIVAAESYSTGESDFFAQLTKIKKANPDVLYLPDYYNSVGLQASQARQLGIKATFLGSDGWDSPELAKIAGNSMDGSFFTNHYTPESTNPMAVSFLKAYKAKYGVNPDALAALAYDACLIVENAIGKAGKLDRIAIRDAMAATKNVPAVCGVLTMGPDRNPIKSAVILQVVGSKFTYKTSVTP
ncbi:MAG: ABC transporter substrate-binding protein [Clostridia bacterium]|nr:ABC transporter substrate-binding protein [Clostridia bacterium]